MAAAKNTGQTSHWAEPFATSGQQHGRHWAGSHGRGQACHCSEVVGQDGSGEVDGGGRQMIR